MPSAGVIGRGRQT